jgi:CRP-like cAMP-binding protein
MKKYISLIEKSLLLNSLSKDKIRSSLKDGSFRVSSYGKNSIIYFSGEVCRELEVILSGYVVIERIDQSGWLMIIADFYGGEVLGGNLLFSKTPYYPMTITAKRATTIVAIDKERLLQLFHPIPYFWEIILSL